MPCGTGRSDRRTCRGPSNQSGKSEQLRRASARRLRKPCGVQQGQGGQDDAVPTGYQQDGPDSGRPLPSSAAEGACRGRSACLRTARRSCAQSPHLPTGSEPLRPPIVISKVVLAGPTPYLVQFLPAAVANPLPMPSLLARRPADGPVSCLRRPMGSEQSGGTRWRGLQKAHQRHSWESLARRLPGTGPTGLLSLTAVGLDGGSGRPLPGGSSGDLRPPKQACRPPRHGPQPDGPGPGRRSA